MLLWVVIVGGLTLMMGQHTRSESLFYYFRLDDQVPENHLLRLIDRHIDFGFVREQLKDSYSDTGRPSIEPELLLRIVLIGYLYGTGCISKTTSRRQRLRKSPPRPASRKGRFFAIFPINERFCLIWPPC
jgi:hypothetical protein